MKPTTARSVLALAIVAGVGGTLHVRAQGDPQGGEAVRVDFQVVGAEGQPVADLKADEVTIRIGGRPRALKDLRFVRVPSGAAAASAPALPAPFGTNAGGGGGEGRRVAMVIEDETLQPGGERALREAIGAFLDKLGPADHVALAIAPRDTARLDFSAGRDRVREALGRLQGRAKAATTAESTCRTRDTLAVLRSQLEAMSGAESPTTVLFMSSHLSQPSTGQSRPSSTGQCEINIQVFREVAAAMAPARAQLYVIQHDPTVSALNEGLQNLAGATSSGQVLRLADAGGTLSRVLAETSGHYMATVDGDPSDRSNQAQRLEVRVSRAGVTTRSRQDLAMPARGASAKPSATTPQQMLREARGFAGLPLRAVAYASRGTSGRMTVIALAEPAEPGGKIAAAAVGLIDPAGKLVAQATGGEKELAQSPIVIATAVPPGTYRLRFAATDAAGRAGAVDYPLVADLTPAGPLKLGSLMIGSLRNTSMAMAIQFRDEEKLVGYLEMYGQVTGQVKARMEIAASMDGPAIATVQPGGSGTSEPDRFILTAEIPIASLAPGDYVVRAIVSMADQPEGTVTKTFRKIAR